MNSGEIPSGWTSAGLQTEKTLESVSLVDSLFLCRRQRQFRFDGNPLIFVLLLMPVMLP